LRDDDFNRPRFAYYSGELDEAARVALRERYVAALGEASAQADDRIVVDWLVRWDAHLLALVRRAMPGTRLVIVESDLRAALLNWLAFGWVSDGACSDVDVAAEWLLRAQRHLAHGAALDEPRRLRVDADKLIAEPILAGADLARFLGIAPLQPEDEFARSAHALGGLPTRFAPGHWHAYQDALAGPFAKLEP
ncbi:MAG: hypothetical protein WBV61_07510, partial [Rhodanobacteraceae bacterium]